MKEHMLHKNQNAQTTVEFIIIVVVLLIVLALVYNMFFSIGQSVDNTQQTSNIYWENADIAIESHTLNASHLTLKFKNNMYNSIRIEKVTLSNVAVESSTQLILQPGQSREHSISYASLYEEGQLYDFDVIILYRNYENGLYYNFTGQTPIIGMR